MPIGEVKLKLNPKQMAHVVNMLAEIPDSMKKSALSAAATKSMAIIRKQTRDNLPSKDNDHTGLLKKSIITVVRTYPKRGVVYSRVGPDKDVIDVDSSGRKRWPVKYAHLVEKGTKAHVIKTKNGSYLHPGSNPNAKGFMRKAYDSSSGRAVKMFGDAMEAWMDKKASQIAAKRPL